MNLSVSQQSFLGMRGFSSGLGSMDTARNSGLTLSNTGRNISLSGKPPNNNTHVRTTTHTKMTTPVASEEKKRYMQLQTTKQKNTFQVPVLDEKDEGQNLKELLTQNELLIRYKKGDEIVSRMKKVFKTNQLQKCVKFRSDKKIQWSPQYFINGNLSNLKGFMSAELLRLNIIAQLQEWDESESDDFDDRSASESEEETHIDEEETHIDEEDENDEEQHQEETHDGEKDEERTDDVSDVDEDSTNAVVASGSDSE